VNDRIPSCQVETRENCATADRLADRIVRRERTPNRLGTVRFRGAKPRGLWVIGMVLCLNLVAWTQDVGSFEKRITLKKLGNGLTVLICERPEAPVFAFHTHVDAGSVQDPQGQTGLAHMFEHMAFKGTDTIGTKDYPAEKVALEKVEQAYAAYIRERDRRINPDVPEVKALAKKWQDAVKQANQYVIPNQFSEIVERNGGEDLNANTSDDETNYFYSMPANRLELWAYLESERFLQPVMRQFYDERNVVQEERRLRVDSNPIGRLLEQFVTAAFSAHEYHRPTIGWMSDLNTFSATDAQAFFQRYYIPSNMVVAVVGDVKATEAMPIIEKYFGKLPSREKPDERTTLEPPQNSERRVILQEAAQPLYLEGYHRPDYLSPDDAVYDGIADLMSSGRTSRLYRALVRDQKIASDAAGFTGLPGSKYPHLFAFYAFPMPGHKPDEMAAAIHREIDKIQHEEISDDELKMIKTRAKANLIRSLGNNPGLAFELAIYQARYDDWRELFRQVDRIDKISKADIRRVAAQTFVPENRTVGIIETAPPASGSRQGGAQ
jgi:predicted Zn-dependent peptidase